MFFKLCKWYQIAQKNHIFLHTFLAFPRQYFHRQNRVLVRLGRQEKQLTAATQRQHNVQKLISMNTNDSRASIPGPFIIYLQKTWHK